MEQGYVTPRCAVTPGVPMASGVCPLFWQHGEDLPPRRFTLAEVSPEPHLLRIEVTTTLAREPGDDVFDTAMPQGPIGLVEPVRLAAAESESFHG